MSNWERRLTGTSPTFFFFLRHNSKYYACTEDRRRSFSLLFTHYEPVLDERHAFAQLQDITFAPLPPLPESEAEQP